MIFSKSEYAKLLECVRNERAIFRVNNKEQLTIEYDLLIEKLEKELGVSYDC